MGMMPDAHEFKVMGLAPYAKEPILKQAYEVFKKGMYVDGLNFKYHERPSDLFFILKIGWKIVDLMALQVGCKDIQKKYY